MKKPIILILSMSVISQVTLGIQYNEQASKQLQELVSKTYFDANTHIADQVDAIVKLVAQGANPNVSDPRRPLLTKLIMDLPDTQKLRGAIKSLLDHGADPNIKDSEGNTILYTVFMSPDVTKMLIDYGADRLIKGSYGFTPLQKWTNDKKKDEDRRKEVERAIATPGEFTPEEIARAKEIKQEMDQWFPQLDVFIDILENYKKSEKAPVPKRRAKGNAS